MFNAMKTAYGNIAIKATAVAAGAMLAVPAFAGDLSDQFSAGVDKAELLLIGGIVLAITGVIFLIKSGRRAGS